MSGTSGKQSCAHTCARCGKQLLGVSPSTKYCPACRAEVNREKALDYKARNPEKVRAAYERRKAATWTPVYCQRCGCEIVNATTHRQKWCPDCKKAIKSQQSQQWYMRRHEAAPAVKQLTCQRCGQPFEVPSVGSARAKYCPACRPIVEAEQHAAGYKRKKGCSQFCRSLHDPLPPRGCCRPRLSQGTSRREPAADAVQCGRLGGHLLRPTDAQKSG